MSSWSKNIVGFITATRIPNQLIIAITQVLTALVLLKKYPEELLTLRFFLLILSTQMIAAAGYIINDYYDQKIDMINRPDRVIIGVKLRRRFALLGHFVLNTFATAIGFWIDPFIGLIHIFSGFMLWFYSNQLRRLPFIGNLTIAALSGLTFLIVSIYFRQESNLVLVYALFACTITLIREIIKDIEDVKGESAYGCETLPVVWGIQGAKIAIYLSTISGVILLITFLITLKNLTLFYYFSLLGPFFLWFIWLLIKAETRQHFAVLHRLCNLIIFSGLISILFLI